VKLEQILKDYENLLKDIMASPIERDDPSFYYKATFNGKGISNAYNRLKTYQDQKGKLLAIEGGGDWADASVEYLVNISDKSGAELMGMCQDSGGYWGNMGFKKWAIKNGYCRKTTDEDLEVIGVYED